MNRIAELRKEKRMNQISLAMKLNVSQKMISAYENGKNEPSIDLLMRMADLFNVSTDYLIGYSDSRSPGHQISDTFYTDLSKNELMRIYDKLSDKNKSLVQGYILGLFASQEPEMKDPPAGLSSQNRL